MTWRGLTGAVRRRRTAVPEALAWTFKWVARVYLFEPDQFSHLSHSPSLSPATAAARRTAMVSWNDLPSSCSDDDDESVTSQLPTTISCYEWSGIAHDLSSCCLHREPCVKLVAFESLDTGRRFLACAQKDELKCNYQEWVDPEWSEALKFCLTKLWSMYEEENRVRLRGNVLNAEENFRVIEEKRKMEEELRFFKLDFAKMVADKEEAITQLGNARLALSDLKDELEKNKLADHGSTNLHQLLRAKAEKERDQLVLERDQVLTERDQLKQEKKKLEYMIADLLKQKHGYKDKIKKLKEICDEF